MKNCRYKPGVTLIEMLVAVALIVLLASMVIGIAGRTDDKAKEQLTQNTFALLNAALEQFDDYGYRYKHSDYSGLEFPLDCNVISISELDIANALGAVSIDPGWTRSEMWCFFLSRVPESREILARIDESLKVGTAITFGGRVHPFVSFLDPWKEPLWYRYYYNGPADKWHFPLITSAGPDRNFGTADDITNR